MTSRKGGAVEEREEAGAAIYAVGDVLTVGTVIFTVLVFAGTYFVCSPGVTDPMMCTAVTKVGLNSFIAHALELSGIVSLSALRIWYRSRTDRATTMSLNASQD